MADVINLRTVRKRAQRRRQELRAETSRLAHGQPKAQRQLEAARRKKAARDLDRHRIDTGDEP